MSLEFQEIVDEAIDRAHNAGYDEGYISGYDDGYETGRSDGEYGEYDRGYGNGVQEGYDDGCSETKSEMENFVAVIRDIENDMHWTLQDGTADDLTAIVAHVRKWQDRLRTELEDAPL